MLQQLLYDWAVFSPAPQDKVSFSPSEFEQELEHSTRQGHWLIIYYPIAHATSCPIDHFLFMIG